MQTIYFLCKIILYIKSFEDKEYLPETVTSLPKRLIIYVLTLFFANPSVLMERLRIIWS